LYFSFNQNFLFEFLDIADVEAVIEFVVEGIHALIDEKAIQIRAEEE
jgi:hypothetical protein